MCYFTIYKELKKSKFWIFHFFKFNPIFAFNLTYAKLAFNFKRGLF